jgi:NADH dehydrogenase FAD-containing subunit
MEKNRKPLMKKIAIIGSGPTGIYTFYHLLKTARRSPFPSLNRPMKLAWVCPITTTIIPG